jgi:hypothetical protein
VGIEWLTSEAGSILPGIKGLHFFGCCTKLIGTPRPLEMFGISCFPGPRIEVPGFEQNYAWSERMSHVFKRLH